MKLIVAEKGGIMMAWARKDEQKSRKLEHKKDGHSSLTQASSFQKKL